ncbi:MAG: DUF1460 domain-containing protein [Bacteroidaceae bacterium]|nr:DUF1460 domain-containing protein [Bacteroidaceae bacterium]
MRTRNYINVCILTSMLMAFVPCIQGATSPQNGYFGSRSAVFDVPAAEAESDIRTDETYLQTMVYAAEDSVRVEQLLQADCGENDVLFFARQFLGTPYVAHTLEVSDPEQLVVNLRQLDCTTLVETVNVLAITHRKGQKRFVDFCRNLEAYRYRGGRMQGYLSRLHYFDWWINDATERGLVSEVADKKHFTGRKRIENSYMSRHYGKYKMLAAHPEWADSLRAMETAGNGAVVSYLPEAKTGLTSRELSCINTGDIVAIVTTKAGLDYSHLGFAVWGRDGRLHLLNASSIHKKVVLEPMTLRQYLSKHSTSVGIRVFRLVP